MKVKMFYSPEQREGTVGAAAVSSDDELKSLAKGDPLRSTFSRERGSLCWKKMPLGIKQLVRSHAWLQGSKRGANEAGNAKLKPASI